MEQKKKKEDSLASGIFIKIVSIVGLGVFIHAFYQVVTTPVRTEWLLLSLVTILVLSRTDIKIPKLSSTVTISDTFVFISVLLYGVAPSVVLAGLDAAVSSLHYPNRRRVMPFNVAVLSLSIYVSGTLMTLVFGDLRLLGPDLSKLILATESLALVHYVLNSGMVSVVSALRYGKNLIRTWHEAFLWTSITYFAGAIAAALVVKLIAVLSFYAFIIAVPILAITYLTYKNYLDKVQASINHAEQMAALHLRTIEALAIAIDAKDEVTHDHVHRVQVYATGLARLFGLGKDDIEALKAGALLHDIGKLAVPDYILNKPGRLTTAEFERMKVHTIVGAEILERVGFPYPVVPVVRHHHERWDGSGYPDRLEGESIPFTARILTVSDCFDAVREDRQYRKAMTREQAIAMLADGRGSAYDPRVVDAFLEHLPEFEAEIKRQKVQLNAGKPAKESFPVAGASISSWQTPFQSIRSAHREVITLYDIAQTIGTSLDLRDTFAVFSSRLQDIVSYTTCVLYLQQADSPEIEATHINGHNAEQFRSKRMPSGAGITGWVVANRQPMYNSDPRLDFDALHLEIEDKYDTVAAVPLIKDGETFGALTLYSKERKSYEPDHLRLIEAVAKLASDAIANALHHERTEAKALTDALTGLPNARALRHQFEEEADRARRHHNQFSLMMMDLDGFKAINDTLGHQAGDEALRLIANLLLSQVRASDFLSRYAGDEFVAIIQAGPEELPELVSRLERTVDGHAFLIANSNSPLGISVGGACYGIDGHTLDELLLSADRAMYASKLKRKSRISGGDGKNTGFGSYRVM
jgi:diguanylate cyclase (GGDEF)-like protein/putative nucleotidyltransferase with HDIG domain